MTGESTNIGGTCPPVGSIISVGVDWVTATATHTSNQELMAEDWAVWMKTFQEMGGEPRKQRRLGYVGYEAQHVFFGSREDGVMLQASGWAADVWYGIVGLNDWHVTRIDVQVTGIPGGDNETFYRRNVTNAVEERARKKRGRPRKITGIEGCGDGNTLAVGARTSQQFGRLYDKHAETPEDFPEGSWRWEVEFKDEFARAAMGEIMRAEDKRAAVLTLVKQFYVERGVEFPFTQETLPIELHVGRIETSDEKSLAWLEKHVSPTVVRLIARGKRDKVMKALKLTEADEPAKVSSEALRQGSGL